MPVKQTKKREKKKKIIFTVMDGVECSTHGHFRRLFRNSWNILAKSVFYLNENSLSVLTFQLKRLFPDWDVSQ